MRYDELTIDGVNLVLVHGDIAGESQRRLVDHVRALLMDGRRRIVLDLSGVRHVDSRGLGELIECYEAARAVGGDVKLLGVNGRVSELLVITKLVSVFECFDARDEAVASFTPMPLPHAIPAAVAAAAR
jgi:anti-sigma B factor antagonist